MGTITTLGISMSLNQKYLFENIELLLVTVHHGTARHFEHSISG